MDGRYLTSSRHWAILWLALLGVALVWTRLVGLDQSLQNDELHTVQQYVLPGPEGIYGEYAPNNHLLFNFLSWATTLALGESEAVFRLWSALPGLAATVLLTWWAWRRLGPWVAVVVGFLIVTSPMQLELLKQARGYGLAMLAAAAMLVAADRFSEIPGRRSLVAWGGAAFVGVASHAAVALGVVGQAAALAYRRENRRPVAFATAGVITAAALFYGPVLDQVVEDTLRYFTPWAADGRPGGDPLVAAIVPSLEWKAPLTGPPSLAAPFFELLFTGTTRPQCEFRCFVGADFARFAAIPALLAVGGAVALWREGRRQLVLLLAGPILFPYVLAVGGLHLQDRFQFYALSYLFVLMAFGLVAGVKLLSPVRDARSAAVALLAALGLFGLARLADLNDRWVALPWENGKQVGAIVNGASVTRVLTNARRSAGFRYYIGDRRVEAIDGGRLGDIFCEATEPLAFIDYRVAGAEEADTTCLERNGASRVRVFQRGRGRFVDVWIAPARDSSGLGFP